MMTEKRRILVVNDDGIDAPGIQALRRALLAHGYSVMVCAPMFERSGAGCSLSLADELEVEPRRNAAGEAPWGYAVKGTPVECVKFALESLGEKPDLVVSGINRGMNIGDSVFYSGTVAGAIEACFHGVPSLATSLACWGDPVSHYDDAAAYVVAGLPWFLAHPPTPRHFWNMNLPNRRLAEYGPLVLASHSTSTFVDDYRLYREEEGLLVYRNAGTRLQPGTQGPRGDDQVLARGGVALSLLTINLDGTFDAPELEPLRVKIAAGLKAPRRAS